MNVIINWLKQCSDCFNPINNNYSHVSNYNNINIRHLAKHCLHIENRADLICYKCFIEFFHYDRFIIRRLFVYLQQQINYIHVNEFNQFAECILNWHEFINHIDFILLLFHIVLSNGNYLDKSVDRRWCEQKDDQILDTKTIDSIHFYELMNDAFFFTAIQSHVDTKLTKSSQIFLERFSNYFCQLNPTSHWKTYIKSIKAILPWAFISIHKWFKTCLLSSVDQLPSIYNSEFNSNLPLTFLWYIINWLTSNKVFLNEHNPLFIYEKISGQHFITKIYDSDKNGYSIIALCESTYNIDGPFLIMFYCIDERIFVILLDDKLVDSPRAYGGPSSLCCQLSPKFTILGRGPSMLYWNMKTRADGPLGVHIWHHGFVRVSIDLNMEHINHPEGLSSISRIEIYKLGVYEPLPLNSKIQYQSSVHRKRNENNVFSVDAHKLAESIGIHLFTQ